MNRLNETVLLSTQNICLNWWVRKYLQFYSKKILLVTKQNIICLSGSDELKMSSISFSITLIYTSLTDHVSEENLQGSTLFSMCTHRGNIYEGFHKGDSSNFPKSCSKSIIIFFLFDSILYASDRTQNSDACEARTHNPSVSPEVDWQSSTLFSIR